jgi:hypothetical protein
MQTVMLETNKPDMAERRQGLESPHKTDGGSSFLRDRPSPPFFGPAPAAVPP